MLVLSRQRDESIVLDFSAITAEDLEHLKRHPVSITVVDLRGDKARLGITAPRAVSIHRHQVYEAIKCEQLVPPDPASGHAARTTAAT